MTISAQKPGRWVILCVALAVINFGVGIWTAAVKISQVRDEFISGTDEAFAPIQVDGSSVRLHSQTSWDNYCTLSYLDVTNNKSHLHYTVDFPNSDVGWCGAYKQSGAAALIKTQDVNHDGQADIEVLDTLDIKKPVYLIVLYDAKQQRFAYIP